MLSLAIRCCQKFEIKLNKFYYYNIMNPQVRNWIYLLIVISIAYWLIMAGVYLFPNISPIIISLIVLVIIYVISSQQSVVLLI